MIQHLFRKLNRALSVITLLSLAACGGGGAGSSLTGGTPSTGTTTGKTTSSYTISLSSAANTVAAGASTVLTATVKDGTGALITNAPVSFKISSNLSGGTLSSASATTANGAASVNYNAGTLSLTDTVLATVTSPDGSIASASTSITVTGGITVGSVTIQTQANQVGTNSTVGIPVIVVVKSANNNLLANVPVTLSADQGNLLLPTPAVTGANGSLTATLTTQNLYKNGVININASAGGMNAIPTALTLSGTTININGSTTASTGVVTPYSLTLLDGNGNPINGQTLNITTSSGAVDSPSVTTNTNGQASFNLTPDLNTILTVASPTLNASSALNVGVNTTTAQFTTPTADYPNASALFNINIANPMVVHVTIAGVPAVNALVAFNTTRGTLSVPTATNPAGDATVSINSSTAGPATITASYNGITTTRQVAFTAPTATQTNVQANPTNLSINGSSTITAQLLDSNNNVVVGKTVTFTTNDTSGGSLFPTSAVTNNIGVATTTFTAGSNTDNEFQITATDVTDGLLGANTPPMSVANKTASIAIGTDNTIQTANPNYIKTYSIFVTDTNGAPIANQAINLALIPQQYAQGYWKLDPVNGWYQVGNSGNSLSYAINSTSTPIATPPATATGDVCTNNDANHDGIFQPQAPYLERTVTKANGSGTPVIAPPAAVASFSPAIPVTNAQGFATVTVTYPQSYAGWVNYNFSATVQVSGTANTNTINFWLPVAAADVAAGNLSGPAGNPSPFGPNVAGSSLYPTNGANCTIVP